jgi:glycerol kinase
MKELVLALDQGTTSSRALVMNPAGEVLGAAQQEINQHFPNPGWVEHNPLEIWESQLATARLALQRARVSARDLAAIGITNQRETALLWERRSGRPVSRAIVWQDRRTAPMLAELKAQGLEPTLRAKTGLLLDPYFSASKLAWLLQGELRNRASELCFGTVESWLIYNLSAGQRHVSDLTNASRTLLLNLKELTWDPELLEIFGIPPEVLPELVEPVGLIAESDPGLLGASVPITAALGDQQAALFGEGCTAAGMAKNTYGTGAFTVMHTGSDLVMSPGVLTTLALKTAGAPAQYALEGSIFMAGATIQWLRDGLGLLNTAAESQDLALSVPDSGGVFMVPALTGLGAPYWDPEARGLIIGLTRGTTKAHLVRAALEAMAYQTKEVIEAMSQAGPALQELRADGGAAENDFLLQFQADLLGVPVVRPPWREATARGAGRLALVGAGVLTLAEAAAGFFAQTTFLPQENPSLDYRGWQKAVARALAWSHE